MAIDLYTLYLYSYAKEYLSSKNRDIIKLEAFSNSSDIKFIDDFFNEEVIANSPIDFFRYLERRQCFNIELGDKCKKGISIHCSCRYSKEYWCRDEKREKNGELVFVKRDELLWITKYRKLTQDEIYSMRRELKIKHYIG